MEHVSISGKTRVLGVIGDPIEHSLSPLLHNYVLGKLGLDYCYLPFHVRSDLAGSVVTAMHTLGLSGLNVTIPHKQVVRDQLDLLSKEAEAVGVVNTVGLDEVGNLMGHNTDVAGFEKSLAIRGLLGQLDGASAVVMGAGGAARAVLYALARNGVFHFTVGYRTLFDHSEELAGWFLYQFPNVALSLVPFEDTHDLVNALTDSAITVNVTPQGMAPMIDRSPLPDGVMPPKGSIVFDTIYTPERTLLLKRAEEAGCQTVNGLDMLIIQGMESLEWWLGREVGWQDMLDELRELLKAALNS